MDTNILIALVDPTDQWAGRAQRDFERVTGQRFVTTPAILSETFFGLRHPTERPRLAAVLRTLDVQPCPVADERTHWLEVFAWSEKYEEHEPSFADAEIAVLAGAIRRLLVWSYDAEFAHIWRRPDGSRIPLVTRPR